MYWKPWHPNLAKVGMCVISQVISVSSCERNWSAHWQIQSKIRNRLPVETPTGESVETATTEMLVYVTQISENQTTYNMVTSYNMYINNNYEQLTMTMNNKDNNVKTTFSHCSNDKTKSYIVTMQ